MGTKVHPKVFRLSTIYRWDSKWFANRRNFVGYLRDDVRLRRFIMQNCKEAGIEKVAIDRNSKEAITINVLAAKPGFIIGRAGVGIEDLKKKIKNEFFRGQRVALNLNVQEVARPVLSAKLVGEQIAVETEKRMPFRRSMKMAVERVLKGGAKGVKLVMSGRLNGAEIARREMISQGSIPLHNLRADIDFANVTANTIYGAIGIKVWIYRGDVFDGISETQVAAAKSRDSRRS
jgi:small subunit ribosomal protein S3